MKKIKIPCTLFDFLYLISLVHPDDELAVEAVYLLGYEEYWEVRKMLQGSIYNFLSRHKIWTSNILEKNWELIEL